MYFILYLAFGCCVAVAVVTKTWMDLSQCRLPARQQNTTTLLVCTQCPEVTESEPVLLSLVLMPLYCISKELPSNLKMWKLIVKFCRRCIFESLWNKAGADLGGGGGGVLDASSLQGFDPLPTQSVPSPL